MLKTTVIILFLIQSVILKTVLPYLQVYDVVHCYLDNDAAGIATTKKIKDEYSNKVIDESVRYPNFKDLNDVINGIV